MSGVFDQNNSPLFSEVLNESDKQIIHNGFEELNSFRLKIHGITIDERTERLVIMTYTHLKHEGTAKEIKRLSAFAELWEGQGYSKIAKALKTRIKEAVELEEGLEDQYNFLVSYDPEEEEEEPAPVTQRSLVAKTLNYCNIFFKVATESI